jgi:hypothetical protein
MAADQASDKIAPPENQPKSRPEGRSAAGKQEAPSTGSAFPSSQITDSITQANVKILGDAPAMALGAVYQALAHSLGITFENAASAQQQNATLAQAVTTRCVQVLLGSATRSEAATKSETAST